MSISLSPVLESSWRWHALFSSRARFDCLLNLTRIQHAQRRKNEANGKPAKNREKKTKSAPNRLPEKMGFFYSIFFVRFQGLLRLLPLASLNPRAIMEQPRITERANEFTGGLGVAPAEVIPRLLRQVDAQLFCGWKEHAGVLDEPIRSGESCRWCGRN